MKKLMVAAFALTIIGGAAFAQKTTTKTTTKQEVKQEEKQQTKTPAKHKKGMHSKKVETAKKTEAVTK